MGLTGVSHNGMLKVKGYIRSVDVTQEQLEVTNSGDVHKTYVAGLRRATLTMELTEFSDIQDIYSMMDATNLPVELHFSEEDVTVSKKLKEPKGSVPVPIYRRMLRLKGKEEV